MDIYFQDDDPDPYAWLKAICIVIFVIISLILIL